MHQEKWIMNQLEKIEVDVEHLRSKGRMTAAGRFLTGMWLEREKARNRKKYGRPKTREAERYIADELNIAPVSVRKHARYARALETIRKDDPELVTQLLSGKRTLSIQKVVEMAEIETGEKRALTQRLRKMSGFQIDPHNRYQLPAQDSGRSNLSIKDMPAYDPDAELTGLTLTVPSWMGSIQRVRSKADLHKASDEAKTALIAALSQLQEQIQDMLCEIEED